MHLFKIFQSKAFKITKWQISLALCIPQLVKPLPFYMYIPEAWKRYRFWALGSTPLPWMLDEGENDDDEV